MTRSTKSHPGDCRHYDAHYDNFQDEIYAAIRREAFGDDIGQCSWLSADEQVKFTDWLGLAAGKTLLDVACGSGGPVLKAAELSGCSVVGVDIHEQAIATAKSQATERGLSGRSAFRVADASKPLPFPDAAFDAITCIDAINHLPDRPRVIKEWARLLKAGGRMLFTDPITVTGPLTNEEIAIRSSIGFFQFVPMGYDAKILEGCGLHVLRCDDVTANTATLAARRGAARATREKELRQIESDATYEAQQQFFEVTSRVALEGRLSRFVYLAEKR
jgi:SAM-dependent methyltransferase